MKMKHTPLPVVAVFAAATLAAVAGWLALDNKASAQTDAPSPANVQVVNGDYFGEVIVSWNAVAGASGYRVRWVDVDEAWVVYNAGGNWQDLIQSVDVAESGATSYTKTIVGLSPGTQYSFSVGTKSGSAVVPAWSGWKNLTPQDRPARFDVQDVVRLQAAALSISQNANALITVGSVPTNASMTRASIGQDVAAVGTYKDAVMAQMEILKRSGPKDRVGYIETLVDRLVSNVDAIQQGRGPLLLALQAEHVSSSQLRKDNNETLFPAALTGKDMQLYQLLTKINGDASSDSDSVMTDDVLSYAHTASLYENVGVGHTLLLVASVAKNPANVAWMQEAYDTTAGRVERDVTYLRENPVPGLDENVLRLAENVRTAGGRPGENDFFQRLEKRLELRAKETDRITENAAILAQLLEQANALSAEVRGLNAPPIPTTTMEEPGVPGVTETEVRFGQSAALTGPSDALGKGMQLGIQAAFKEVNDSGGVHGRMLTLKTEDDRYEPDAAFSNTVRLIETEQVFGLIGAVGTPTSRAALPVAQDAGVPFVGAFTGAQLLRDDDLIKVLNYRASYHQETARMVELLGEAGVTKVAVLYQIDSYGHDGLTGVKNALDDRDDMELVASWYYDRNTTAVKAAVYRIANAQEQPEAVIIIGAYQPAAQAIEELRRKLGEDTTFLNVSFVGSNALSAELGDAGEGVYVTQVVPLPSDAGNDVVAKYRTALSAYAAAAEPGFISLEGYLAGRLAIERLAACGVDVTRECFLNVFSETTTVDIDGLRLQYGPGDNQGSDDVFLTVINSDGDYELADSIER